MKIFSTEGYEIVMLGAGIAMFLGAWLPQLIVKRHVTLAALYFLIGVALFYFLESSAPDPLQEKGRIIWEKLSELVVIVSLLGAGLKIDTSFTSPKWKITWRLLAITMPLSIALGGVLGWWLLGLSPAAALLLGAVLSPTDPVLANDVQVGPPGEGKADNTRFGLTSEASLNDALAFPFTYLAIMWGANGTTGSLDWLGEWFWKALLFKVAVGLLIGWLTGWGLAKIMFNYPKKRPLAWEMMGGLALCILFISYALTEICGGYGFLAVFLAAYYFRRQECEHKYNKVLHEFTDNIERSAAALILILMGGLTAQFLPYIEWPVVLYSLVFLLAIRPISGWLALSGLGLPTRQRKIISIYGIRGIGSVYYLAYAGGHLVFNQPETLWATMLFVIFLSALLHGLTAYPTMQSHDNKTSPTLETDFDTSLSGPVKNGEPNQPQPFKKD